MSSDSLYFTASPSAAILDPMGWTQTSYMPGRLEDPASRLSALANVAPTRLAPAVDAAGSWGLDSTGPDLSALYKGAATSAAADPDAPPEPDPEWLGLPIEEIGDAVSDQVAALAQRTDDLQSPAWTPEEAPGVSAQPTVFAVTRLKPGSYLQYMYSLPRKLVSKSARADDSGKVLVNVYDTNSRPTLFNLSFTASDGVRHNGYNLIVSGAGADSKIAMRFAIGATPNKWQMGTTYSGYTINVPTATEVRFATAAYNWAIGTTQLPGLTKQMTLGLWGAVRLVRHYHVLAYHGGNLISNIGQLVNGGVGGAKTGIAPTVKKASFWGALDRLQSALKLDAIAKAAATEAKGARSPLLSGSHTIATWAMDGFFSLHPEIRGHTPLKVQTSTATWWNYGFSYWARARLVELYYTLKGSFAGVVRRGMQTAAAGADLKFLIDGRGDAWDGKKVIPHTDRRGRELQVQPRDCPAIPFLNFQVLRDDGNDQFLGQIFQTAQDFGIARTVAAYFADLIGGRTTYGDETGIQPVFETPPQWFADAIDDRFHDNIYFLAGAIMGALTLPGAIVDVQMGGRRITQRQLHEILERTGPATDLNFEQILLRYMFNPLDHDNDELLDEYFQLDFPVLLVNAGYAGNIADVNVIRTIINTLLVGGDTLQGYQFNLDPFIELIEHQIVWLDFEVNNRVGPGDPFPTLQNFTNFAAQDHNLFEYIDTFVVPCERLGDPRD